MHIVGWTWPTICTALFLSPVREFCCSVGCWLCQRLSLLFRSHFGCLYCCVLHYHAFQVTEVFHQFNFLSIDCYLRIVKVVSYFHDFGLFCVSAAFWFICFMVNICSQHDDPHLNLACCCLMMCLEWCLPVPFQVLIVVLFLSSYYSLICLPFWHTYYNSVLPISWCLFVFPYFIAQVS